MELACIGGIRRIGCGDQATWSDGEGDSVRMKNIQAQLLLAKRLTSPEPWLTSVIPEEMARALLLRSVTLSRYLPASPLLAVTLLLKQPRRLPPKRNLSPFVWTSPCWRGLFLCAGRCWLRGANHSDGMNTSGFARAGTAGDFRTQAVYCRSRT